MKVEVEEISIKRTQEERRRDAQRRGEKEGRESLSHIEETNIPRGTTAPYESV